MKTAQSGRLKTAHHVQEFMHGNATVLGPNVTSARRSLHDAVDQLTATAVR